ncbi:proteasome inhibitor PI31 subunit-like isoform X2 [Teleopsis dalmanni]|uniref:proteasome inhibitor PI31 subunit-like isoform X2 n=1 Tax=Teleopsis dalmanni TaxID=139649 RepID=UPI0018CEF4AE|nr:proteasome inhibitor PI31 subunit-like isoform X2 [Teleopsis dalmanni]
MSSPQIKDIDEIYFFGWDMLVKSIEKDIVKKADVVLILAHFMLVMHYKFQCLGIGEDQTFSEDEIGSELLPELWNAEDFDYRLRYLQNNQLYLLIGNVISEGKILLNLLSVESKNVSNILFDPEEVVKSFNGKIYTMIPDAAAITDRIRRELIETVIISRNANEACTQTETERVPRQSIDPMRATVPSSLRGQFASPRHQNEFPQVDRGNLNPFGPGATEFQVVDLTGGFIFQNQFSDHFHPWQH